MKRKILGAVLMSLVAVLVLSPALVSYARESGSDLFGLTSMLSGTCPTTAAKASGMRGRGMCPMQSRMSRMHEAARAKKGEVAAKLAAEDASAQCSATATGASCDSLAAAAKVSPTADFTSMHGMLMNAASSTADDCCATGATAAGDSKASCESLAIAKSEAK